MEKYLNINRTERFENADAVSCNYLEDAMAFVLKRIDKNMDIFINSFPLDHSENNVYTATDNSNWTTGFWPGLLWLAYDYTGDDKYRHRGEHLITSFRERFDNAVAIDNHDLGFLYTLSCVAPYKLTGNREAADLAVKAAYHLLGRYRSNGKFILAWGSINTPDNPRGNRMIIDCMMNLPLLYWASSYTGNSRFAEIAHTHADTSLEFFFRNDSSTHHTFFFDYYTGKPIRGEQHQGYDDNSCWARGQAWAAYGYALSYSHTHKHEYLAASVNAVNYFLNHIPEDDLCYYDLCFMAGNEPRDSSANALVCCAILELLKHLPVSNSLCDIYRAAAARLMRSLTEKYTTRDIPDSNGILKLGTVAKPPRPSNECTIYGDYYYFEALLRMYKSWHSYW